MKDKVKKKQIQLIQEQNFPQIRLQLQYNPTLEFGLEEQKIEKNEEKNSKKQVSNLEMMQETSSTFFYNQNGQQKQQKSINFGSQQQNQELSDEKTEIFKHIVPEFYDFIDTFTFVQVQQMQKEQSYNFLVSCTYQSKKILENFLKFLLEEKLYFSFTDNQQQEKEEQQQMEEEQEQLKMGEINDYDLFQTQGKMGSGKNLNLSQGIHFKMKNKRSSTVYSVVNQIKILQEKSEKKVFGKKISVLESEALQYRNPEQNFKKYISKLREKEIQKDPNYKLKNDKFNDQNFAYKRNSVQFNDTIEKGKQKEIQKHNQYQEQNKKDFYSSVKLNNFNGFGSVQGYKSVNQNLNSTFCQTPILKNTNKFRSTTLNQTNNNRFMKSQNLNQQNKVTFNTVRNLEGEEENELENLNTLKYQYQEIQDQVLRMGRKKMFDSEKKKLILKEIQKNRTNQYFNLSQIDVRSLCENELNKKKMQSSVQCSLGASLIQSKIQKQQNNLEQSQQMEKNNEKSQNENENKSENQEQNQNSQQKKQAQVQDFIAQKKKQLEQILKKKEQTFEELKKVEDMKDFDKFYFQGSAKKLVQNYDKFVSSQISFYNEEIIKQNQSQNQDQNQSQSLNKKQDQNLKSLFQGEATTKSIRKQSIYGNCLVEKNNQNRVSFSGAEQYDDKKKPNSNLQNSQKLLETYLNEEAPKINNKQYKKIMDQQTAIDNVKKQGDMFVTQKPSFFHLEVNKKSGALVSHFEKIFKIGEEIKKEKEEKQEKQNRKNKKRQEMMEKGQGINKEKEVQDENEEEEDELSKQIREEQEKLNQKEPEWLIPKMGFKVQVITPQYLIRFLSEKYPQKTAAKIVQFLEPPSMMNYSQFTGWLECFNKWKFDDILFFTFYLMDLNEDGLICQQDVFYWVKSGKINGIEDDMVKIQGYVEQNYKEVSFEPREEEIVFPEIFQSEKSLSYSYYLAMVRNVFIKKLKQNEVKKDTIHHLGWLAINHDNEKRLLEQIEIYDEEDPLERQLKNDQQFIESIQKKKQIEKNMQNIKKIKKETKEYVKEITGGNQVRINLLSFQKVFQNCLPNFFIDFINFLCCAEREEVDYGLLNQMNTGAEKFKKIKYKMKMYNLLKSPQKSQNLLNSSQEAQITNNNLNININNYQNKNQNSNHKSQDKLFVSVSPKNSTPKLGSPKNSVNFSNNNSQINLQSQNSINNFGSQTSYMNSIQHQNSNQQLNLENFDVLIMKTINQAQFDEKKFKYQSSYQDSTINQLRKEALVTFEKQNSSYIQQKFNKKQMTKSFNKTQEQVYNISSQRQKNQVRNRVYSVNQVGQDNFQQVKNLAKNRDISLNFQKNQNKKKKKKSEGTSNYEINYYGENFVNVCDQTPNEFQFYNKNINNDMFWINKFSVNIFRELKPSKDEEVQKYRAKFAVMQPSLEPHYKYLFKIRIDKMSDMNNSIGIGLHNWSELQQHSFELNQMDLLSQSNLNHYMISSDGIIFPQPNLSTQGIMKKDTQELEEITERYKNSQLIVQKQEDQKIPEFYQKCNLRFQKDSIISIVVDPVKNVIEYEVNKEKFTQNMYYSFGTQYSLCCYLSNQDDQVTVKCYEIEDVSYPIKNISKKGLNVLEFPEYPGKIVKQIKIQDMGFGDIQIIKVLRKLSREFNLEPTKKVKINYYLLADQSGWIIDKDPFTGFQYLKEVQFKEEIEGEIQESELQQKIKDLTQRNMDRSKNVEQFEKLGQKYKEIGLNAIQQKLDNELDKKLQLYYQKKKKQEILQQMLEISQAKNKGIQILDNKDKKGKGKK